MLILSRVCAEFHDRAGAVLFAIRPSDRLLFVEAPESIHQDPLFDMLLRDGSIQMPETGKERAKLENDPEGKIQEEESEASAPAASADPGKKAARKPAESK